MKVANVALNEAAKAGAPVPAAAIAATQQSGQSGGPCSSNCKDRWLIWR